MESELVEDGDNVRELTGVESERSMLTVRS